MLRVLTLSGVMRWGLAIIHAQQFGRGSGRVSPYVLATSGKFACAWARWSSTSLARFLAAESVVVMVAAACSIRLGGAAALDAAPSAALGEFAAGASSMK